MSDLTPRTRKGQRNREWAAEVYGDLSDFDPRHVDTDRLTRRVEAALKALSRRTVG